MGITHVLLPLHSSNFFAIRRNIRLLMDLIEREQVDIVEAFERAPAWAGLFAARRTGRALITQLRDPLPAAGRKQDFFNSVLGRGDRVVTYSAFSAAQAMTQFSLPAARMAVIPRGIDLFRFNPDHVTPERMATLAEGWRLRDGFKVIFCPARLGEGRGQELLLQALARLERRDFICVLAGPNLSGNRDAIALEQLALDLNLEGNVTMVGHCADMPTAYMLADVVAVPRALPLGFARVVVEAQAMGRPVIATDVGAQAEGLLAGETGWLLPQGDVAALAATMEQALELTREQRLRVASQAVAHVRDNFNREQMCWAMLDVYASLYAAPVPWQLAQSA